MWRHNYFGTIGRLSVEMCYCRFVKLPQVPNPIHFLWTENVSRLKRQIISLAKISETVKLSETVFMSMFLATDPTFVRLSHCELNWCRTANTARSWQSALVDAQQICNMRTTRGVGALSICGIVIYSHELVEMHFVVFVDHRIVSWTNQFSRAWLHLCCSPSDLTENYELKSTVRPKYRIAKVSAVMNDMSVTFFSYGSNFDSLS